MIDKIKLKDKARILCGHKTMSTYPIKEFNIKELKLSDGPNGVRIEDRNGNSLGGISNSLPATCFPSGSTLSSSWNRDLLKKVGEAIGEECNYYDVNVILGPAINIKRNPKCGRSFEYYSEDPLLSGYLACEYINGVQSKNVLACLKHFACNNNEKYRFCGNSIVDSRALHEIYLKPFELAVKNTKVGAVMNSYNQINGIYSSENKYLLTELLRNKWGFEGLIMTDWGGIVDRVKGLKAGTDLEMPGMVKHSINRIINSVNNNELDINIVDKSVERIIKAIEKTKEHNNYCDFDKNYNLAIEAAIDGAVLLKNNDHILPLNNKNKIIIVGGLFEEVRYQGSGSSLINPYKLSYHKVSLNKRNIKYQYYKGYIASEPIPNISLEEEVLNNINNYDYILYYCGQNDYIESEGFDRETVELPENQLSLLNKLIKLNKKIILVLFGGSMIELPFYDNVSAILYMGLPGEGIGEATTSLIFGEKSPSGRLTETWPIAYSDVLFGNEFTSSPNEIYKESIFVGYRYYNTINKKVRFPFGYGLSYSEFSYSNFKIEKKEDIIVSCRVKNLKAIEASTVLQVYTSINDSKIYRPNKELKGFTKVLLAPYEEKNINITIKKEDLMVYYDNEFVLENGFYDIYLSNNVNEDFYKETIFITGKALIKDSELTSKYYSNLNNLVNITIDDYMTITNKKIIPYEKNKRPYTLETPIEEFDTLFGKLFRKIMCSVGYHQYKKGCRMKDGPEKERMKKAGLFVYKLMPYNSLRTICYSSSGMLSYKMANVILEFVNKNYFKGIKLLFKRDIK